MQSPERGPPGGPASCLHSHLPGMLRMVSPSLMVFFANRPRPVRKPIGRMEEGQWLGFEHSPRLQSHAFGSCQSSYATMLLLYLLGWGRCARWSAG